MWYTILLALTDYGTLTHQKRCQYVCRLLKHSFATYLFICIGSVSAWMNFWWVLFCSSSIFNTDKAAYWLNWDRLLRYTIIPCVYMYKTPVTILSTWIRWDQWTSHLLISFVSLQMILQHYGHGKNEDLLQFLKQDRQLWILRNWLLISFVCRCTSKDLTVETNCNTHTHCAYKFTLHFLLRLSFQWFVLAKFHNVKFMNPNRRQSQCLSSGWNRLWVFCATNVSR